MYMMSDSNSPVDASRTDFNNWLLSIISDSVNSVIKELKMAVKLTRSDAIRVLFCIDIVLPVSSGSGILATMSVMVNGCAIKTITLNISVAALPESSVAVQETDVYPITNNVSN